LKTRINDVEPSLKVVCVAVRSGFPAGPKCPGIVRNGVVSLHSMK